MSGAPSYAEVASSPSGFMAKATLRRTPTAGKPPQARAKAGAKATMADDRRPGESGPAASARPAPSLRRSQRTSGRGSATSAAVTTAVTGTASVAAAPPADGSAGHNSVRPRRTARRTAEPVERELQLDDDDPLVGGGSVAAQGERDGAAASNAAATPAPPATPAAAAFVSLGDDDIAQALASINAADPRTPAQAAAPGFGPAFNADGPDELLEARERLPDDPDDDDFTSPARTLATVTGLMALEFAVARHSKVDPAAATSWSRVMVRMAAGALMASSPRGAAAGSGPMSLAFGGTTASSPRPVSDGTDDLVRPPMNASPWVAAVECMDAWATALDQLSEVGAEIPKTWQGPLLRRATDLCEAFATAGNRGAGSAARYLGNMHRLATRRARAPFRLLVGGRVDLMLGAAASAPRLTLAGPAAASSASAGFDARTAAGHAGSADALVPDLDGYDDDSDGEDLLGGGASGQALPHGLGDADDDPSVAHHDTASVLHQARAKKAMNVGFVTPARETAAQALSMHRPLQRAALCVLTGLQVEQDADAADAVTAAATDACGGAVASSDVGIVVRAVALAAKPGSDPLAGVPLVADVRPEAILTVIATVLALTRDKRRPGSHATAVLEAGRALASWGSDLRAELLLMPDAICPHAPERARDLCRAFGSLFASWALEAVAEASAAARARRQPLQLRGAPDLGVRLACSVVAALVTERDQSPELARLRLARCTGAPAPLAPHIRQWLVLALVSRASAASPRATSGSGESSDRARAAGTEQAAGPSPLQLALRGTPVGAVVSAIAGDLKIRRFSLRAALVAADPVATILGDNASTGRVAALHRALSKRVNPDLVGSSAAATLARLAAACRISASSSF